MGAFLRTFSSLALGAALVLRVAPASAFCRSTTCVDDCARDGEGCKVTGKKLAWPGLCVGVSLQRDGTANIPIDQVRLAVEAAFAAWSDVDCGKGAATIAFSALDDVTCHETAYDDQLPNANVILFQDTRWQYKGEDNNLAKTTVTFDADTGMILDADIEINHAYNEFTVADDDVVNDLQSILTHEIGHFIGLDHTLAAGATLDAGYEEGSTEPRTLEADDVEGLCEAYPPERSGFCDATPRNGLADACAAAVTEPGCTVSSVGSGGGDASRRGAGPVSLAVLFLGALRRRRARIPRMRQWALFIGLLAGAAASIASCGPTGGDGSSDATGTGGGGPKPIVCVPGENIFCRCPGGDAGTKTCQPDGRGFDECFTRTGACAEIPDTTAVASSSSAGGGGTGSGSGGGGASPGELYEPCVNDGACDSGLCLDGYCTKECAKYDECTLGSGECVQFQGTQFCMPVCTLNVECEDVYGAPSACGYTTAVDGAPVLACADWKASLKVPPEGTGCVDDAECNLGHEGVQAVCTFDTCTKGCYVATDCPPNTTCSSEGNLGSCE